jgi:hypothetical protein
MRRGLRPSDQGAKLPRAVADAQGSVHTVPNPYEAPMCQETNYPYERIFCFFSALGFLAQSADGLVF